jgi:hypothetical protein
MDHGLLKHIYDILILEDYAMISSTKKRALRCISLLTAGNKLFRIGLLVPAYKGIDKDERR